MTQFTFSVVGDRGPASGSSKVADHWCTQRLTWMAYFCQWPLLVTLFSVVSSKHIIASNQRSFLVLMRIVDPYFYCLDFYDTHTIWFSLKLSDGFSSVSLVESSAFFHLLNVSLFSCQGSVLILVLLTLCNVPMCIQNT